MHGTSMVYLYLMRMRLIIKKQHAIYRIQDKEGRGPWRPGFSHLWVESRDDHNNLVPWYVEFGNIDNLLETKYIYGCGCKTIDQLKRWFTKTEYEKLKNYGYEAVKIKINKIVVESDIQCVFARKKALNKSAVMFKLY